MNLGTGSREPVQLRPDFWGAEQQIDKFALFRPENWITTSEVYCYCASKSRKAWEYLKRLELNQSRPITDYNCQ